MKNIKKILSLISLGAANFILVTKSAIAVGYEGSAPGGPINLEDINPLKVGSFTELFDKIINYAMVIGGSLLVLMIIIGAFQILTSAGNPEKVTTGRKTITYACIAYAVILLSKGIISIIESVLGV